ncbi:MAG: hypothetical protein L0L71_10025, partial [Lactococcus sp.]
AIRKDLPFWKVYILGCVPNHSEATFVLISIILIQYAFLTSFCPKQKVRGHALTESIKLLTTL